MGVIHKPECTGQDPNTSLPIQDVLSVAKHDVSMKYNPLSTLNIEQTPRTAITADPGLDLDLFQQEFCEYMGFDESIPVPVVINQITGGLFPPVPDNKEKINYILAFVVQENPASLNCQNSIEPHCIASTASAQHQVQAHLLCTPHNPRQLPPRQALQPHPQQLSSQDARWHAPGHVYPPPEPLQ
jgi:hypothetical protein